MITRIRRVAALAAALFLACDAGSGAGADVPADGTPGTPGELAADRVIVHLDPWGVAPLSAGIEVRGFAAGTVQRMAFVLSEPDGGELRQDFDPTAVSFKVRYDLSQRMAPGAVGIPVLGLFPGRDNPVRIEVTTAAGVCWRDLVVTTGELPALPTIEIATRDEARMEPGWNLAGFSSVATGVLLLPGEAGLARRAVGADPGVIPVVTSDFQGRPFLFDARGRVRWVLRVDKALGPGFSTPVAPLANGNLVMGLGSYVYEYDLMGREVNVWLLPAGYEQDHDVFEMPGGNLLVSAGRMDSEIRTVWGQVLSGASDHVLELRRDTGAVVNDWDLRGFLDLDRFSQLATWGSVDWFHLNSVVYSPSDDSIIVSGRNQGVAKISRGGEAGSRPNAGNKALRWILAAHRGWGRAGVNGTGADLEPFLLGATAADGTPLAADVQEGTTGSPAFGWPFGQHGLQLQSDGHLLMFDNGNERDLGLYPGQPFSRAVEYRIDEAAGGTGGTVTQVWEYGRERGAELYDPIISNVMVGPVTGNRFINPGSYTVDGDGTPGGTARMVEVTYPDRVVVFEARLHMTGRQAWGNDVCYRQRRMPLFPP